MSTNQPNHQAQTNSAESTHEASRATNLPPIHSSEGAAEADPRLSETIDFDDSKKHLRQLKDDQ